MTLTAALRAALDPAAREHGIVALKAISTLYDDNEKNPEPALSAVDRHLAAGLLLWMLGVAPELGPNVANAMRTLISVGADLSGAKVTNGKPDWSVTMPRLAAWADGEVT